MMATSRNVSVTTRTGTARKRLAVAAGSFVAVSASVSAFLVDTSASSKAQLQHGVQQQQQQQQQQQDNRSFWNQLYSHRSGVAPTSVFYQWLSESSAPRVWSKLRADDDIDAKVVPAKDAIATARVVSETLRNRFRVGDSYVWLYQDADGNPTSWEKYTVASIDERVTTESGDGEGPEFVATIEMSTKFDEDEAYQTHHRIKANLIDHVMESSDSREGWRIGFEFFQAESDGGVWKIFGKGDNVQAFEEKFDVFSMVSAAAVTATAAVERATAATEGSNENATKNQRDEYLLPWTSSRKTLCETENSSTRSASLGVRTKGENNNGTTKAVSAVSRAERQTAKLTRTKRHGYTEAWYGPSNHDTLSGIALYKEFPSSQHSFSLIERTTRDAEGTETVTDAIEVIL